MIRCNLVRERNSHGSSCVTAHNVRRARRQSRRRERHGESTADRKGAYSPRSLNILCYFRSCFHFSNFSLSGVDYPRGRDCSSASASQVALSRDLRVDPLGRWRTNASSGAWREEARPTASLVGIEVSISRFLLRKRWGEVLEKESVPTEIRGDWLCSSSTCDFKWRAVYRSRCLLPSGRIPDFSGGESPRGEHRFLGD